MIGEPIEPAICPFAPGRGGGGGASRKAYLYSAVCRGSQDWAGDLGFAVRHIGLAADPIARLDALNAIGYGSAARAPFDGFCWEDGWSSWRLAPLEPSVVVLPVELPSGASLDMIARRLLVMLAPLEAVRCADFPSVVAERPEGPRPGPRYAQSAFGLALVRDLYRWQPMIEILVAALRAAVDQEVRDHVDPFGVSFDLMIAGRDCLGAGDVAASMKASRPPAGQSRPPLPGRDPGEAPSKPSSTR